MHGVTALPEFLGAPAGHTVNTEEVSLPALGHRGGAPDLDLGLKEGLLL